MTLFIGIIAVLILFLTQGFSGSLFLNFHSLSLVCGGTFCVVLLMTPKNNLIDLAKLIFNLYREDREISNAQLIGLIKNPQATMQDPLGLIAQARDLWELGIGDDEFETLLTERAESILNRNLGAIAVLRNLGKYPPAIGMVGTVMGMIQLFSGLGGSTTQGQIGGQLALAMTATFYGLLLSNFILMPLADRLEVREESRRVQLGMIVKTLMTIQRKQPALISERVIHVA